MLENQKCQQFSKMSEIQKSLKFPMGGGSSLFGNFPQIFPFFLMMAPLNKKYLSQKNVGSMKFWVRKTFFQHGKPNKILGPKKDETV